ARQDRLREREPYPMAARKGMRHVVEAQARLDGSTGLEQLPGLVSCAMRQVDGAVAHPGRAAVGGDVAESREEERRRSIRRDDEPDLGRSEDLEPLDQRLRIEAQGL